MRILQVNMFDVFGGAEKVASDLAHAYRALGHDSSLVVGRKRSNDPSVLTVPHHLAASAWPRLWWRIHRRLQPYYGGVAGSRLLCRLAHALAEPEGILDRFRGIEDFNYPGAWRLLESLNQPEATARTKHSSFITHHSSLSTPDIIHCHNLHQKYFDLRALPWLSRQVPVFLTLHDAWLLSGHCAHSFDCRRWRAGCGDCPDLTIHPPIRRDATALNWRRKRDIYAQCRLHVATPCRWLMDKVEQSMLAPGVVDARIIPYGIDRDVFHPADQVAARSAVGIPTTAAVLLFAASGIRRNPWKDYQTMRQVVSRLAEGRFGRRLLFVALGEDSQPETIGSAQIRFVPFQADPRVVANFYQAADVYIHAARADTFPNAVLEALACGTPVVATAVGGIPEQVSPFPLPGSDFSTPRPVDAAGRPTGILVRAADAAGMAAAVEHLLGNAPLRCRLGANAAADAASRFDLRRQARDYLDWYSAVRLRPSCRQAVVASTGLPEPVRGMVGAGLGAVCV